MAKKYNTLTSAQNFDLCTRIKSHIAEPGAKKFASYDDAATHFAKLVGVKLTGCNIRGAVKAIGAKFGDVIDAPNASGAWESFADMKRRVESLESIVATLSARIEKELRSTSSYGQA